MSHFIQNGVSDPEQAQSASLYTCLEHVHDVFLCVWEKTDTTHSKVKELLFIERLCNIDALEYSSIVLFSSPLPSLPPPPPPSPSPSPF